MTWVQRSHIDIARGGEPGAGARCRNGSVQTRESIQRLHKSPHSYIFSSSLPVISECNLHVQQDIMGKRDGVTCVIFVGSVLREHCYPYT